MYIHVCDAGVCIYRDTCVLYNSGLIVPKNSPLTKQLIEAILYYIHMHVLKYKNVKLSVNNCKED